ncbi:hypothetical protein H7B90_12360 [Cohnella xylanilytica]|uniref:Peptide O-xylosyltransferase n=1 Tax=Cohnella xylanilytica TaxID=557555 RepID=A0A841TVI7_9BACL|nr:beta-1,6-N-acetylglucosaminyltransferase [Cohnella xylanilytica]MBB6692195.1 hypothetical protein [Cohnella xylanilytica]
MSVAYFIMAHHKPSMLLRMMNAIYSEENIYLIHIDSRADDEMLDLARNLQSSNDNIHLLPSRFLNWGGWSLVQAELDAIRVLLNWSRKWTHLINLSGQDFPLVKQDLILSFLNDNKERNFILAKPTDPAMMKGLQGAFVIEDAKKYQRLGEREPFESYFTENIRQYSGSQWKMITRSFAEYAVDSYLSYEMQDYYRYSFTPDEYFFPTLIQNSPFSETVVPNIKRFIRMEAGEHSKNHATLLTIDDLGSLFSNDTFFARKFDDEVDSKIIDAIEEMLALRP